MITGEFVKELVAHTSRPSTVEDQDGRKRLLIPHGWTDATPKKPLAAPIVVGTLTGFVEAVKTNVDGLPLAECLVHVQSPGLVALRAKLEAEGQDFRRQTYLLASTELVGGAPFPFGQYLDAEQFFIGLQSLFVPTATRDEILTLLAAIRESTVRETVDDGAAQEVKTGMGVALVGPQRVPNPVTLQPYRTFREVDQPESSFVLRLKSGQGDKPLCALFEADGGIWKLTAIQRIADFLRGALGASPAVIA